MTFKECMLLVKGYHQRTIEQYKHTRLLMFMMARMWGDPKKGPKSPEELWPLPGDEKKTGQLNEDEIKAVFDAIRAKHGG